MPEKSAHPPSLDSLVCDICDLRVLVDRVKFSGCILGRMTDDAAVYYLVDLHSQAFGLMVASLDTETEGNFR